MPKERYPKYIIPYTPIALAVILAVLLMPLIFRYIKRFVLLTISVISLVVFFIFELLLESQVIVTSTVESTLESWQMYMCISLPSMYGTQTWSALDILMGQYNPAFKIHFYMISYAGSFVLGRHCGISVIFPALTASLITFLMYTGEMILLSGRLYRFGTGLFFDGIAGIVLAPVDILIVLLSGGITAGICCWFFHYTSKL